MKAINVPVSNLRVAGRIPTQIPVQFEFEFCEQCCEQIVNILGSQDIDMLDAVDLPVIPYAKRRAWLRALAPPRSNLADPEPRVSIVRARLARRSVSGAPNPNRTKRPHNPKNK